MTERITTDDARRDTRQAIQAYIDTLPGQQRRYAATFAHHLTDWNERHPLTDWRDQAGIDRAAAEAFDAGRGIARATAGIRCAILGILADAEFAQAFGEVHRVVCDHFQAHIDPADMMADADAPGDLLIVTIWGDIDDPMSEAYGRSEPARAPWMRLWIRGHQEQRPQIVRAEAIPHPFDRRKAVR